MNNSTPLDAGWYLDEYDGPRFWAHVSRSSSYDYSQDPLATAAGACWQWQGMKSETGYGTFSVFGRQTAAHRIAYQEFGKRLEDTLSIDHLCRNRSCVNPDHLEAVTHLENVRRGIRGHITHCPAGHEYTTENTEILVRRGKNVRYCRICLKASRRRTYQRRKAAGKV